MYLETQFKLQGMKNQVLLTKICIRILSAPDPKQLFGSGSCKKVRILNTGFRYVVLIVNVY